MTPPENPALEFGEDQRIAQPSAGDDAIAATGADALSTDVSALDRIAEVLLGAGVPVGTITPDDSTTEPAPPSPTVSPENDVHPPAPPTNDARFAPGSHAVPLSEPATERTDWDGGIPAVVLEPPEPPSDAGAFGVSEPFDASDHGLVEQSERATEMHPGTVDAVRAESPADGVEVGTVADEPDMPPPGPADVLDALPWDEITPEHRPKRTGVIIAATVAAIALLGGGFVWLSGRDSDEPTKQNAGVAPVTTIDAESPIAAPAIVGTGSSDPTWNLVWSDEFDGTALDTTKWTPEHSTYGDANGEEQCHTPENVMVANGNLVLEARAEETTCPSGDVEDFSSGLIRSQNKFSTSFGRFEVRAKLPAGQGLWPAFWLLSNNYPYGREGRSGELDVFEMIGSEPAKIVGTAHWTYDGCGWACSRLGAEYTLPGVNTVDDFHVYALNWAPNHISWEVDGVVYYAMGDGEKHQWSSAAKNASPKSMPYPAPFDEGNPMYMILNLSVGGKLSGEVDETTVFPAQYLVDYVRVYKPAG